MAAPEFNLEVEQGATFTAQLNITDDADDPVDLSTATVTAQMRKFYSSTDYFEFTADMSEAAEGKVYLTLTAAETAQIPAGDWLYDAQYQIGTTVVRIVRGTVNVYPRVTQ